MGCKGLHCDGCNHGSGGGPAAAVIALLVIIAVAARSAWPHVVHAVEIIAWTVAGMTGAVIVVTGGVLTARVLRRRQARRALAYRHGQPVIVAVDEVQRWYTTQLPPAGRAVPGQIEPPPRWPVSGWPGARDWQPQTGGDGDEPGTR